MAPIKPSSTFTRTYNQLKPGGLNEQEVTKLLSQAQKEISQSDKPHTLAKVYEKEVKGWVKKGIAEKYGTAEMGGWILKTTADTKAIKDGAKFLKANAAALQAKHPELKTLDLKSTRFADFGDAGYLAVNDSSGKAVLDTDPRAKKLKQLLGPEFKSVTVGTPSEVF
jgi:hypothetical protein